MSDAAVTCLVVEDEPTVREVVARVLEGAGYRVLQAGSGGEALALLGQEHERVELVISDLQMPGMDGAELLREVRRRWPDIGTVIVTGVAEISTVVQLLQAGAYDYITKPFGIDEVIARVRQALEKKRLVAENRRYQVHLADLVRQQASRIEELFLEAVQTLVDALEAKDAYTRGHSMRVSAYAVATARTLGMSDSDIDLIQLGAELHDVGKIGVRESVLLKPGRLTDPEYQHIMEHTIIGARILAPLFKNAPQALAIVRSHHERMDGRGFPDRLDGDQIPVFARVVCVADAFDAMTSGRTYRIALGAEQALEEVRTHMGTQFDRDVVRAFIQTHEQGDLGLPAELPRVHRHHLPVGIAWVPALNG
jgi:putative two-component system response regulator